MRPVSVPFGRIPIAGNHLAREGRLARASALLLMHRQRSITISDGQHTPCSDVSITDESGFTEALLEQHDERRVRDRRTGLSRPITGIAGCCAPAVSGHAAAPPSAASNSRRPMVTVMRPSRMRCVK